MEIAFSPTSPVSAPDLVDLCVEAERLGYRQAWLAEVAGPEAFALAGAVATRTSRLDIGVAVVPASTRTPALMAMGAATVSQLARGRSVLLGVGSSSRVIVEDWHGRGFDPPLLRVREAVEATRALLGGAREYLGTTVRVSRFRLGVTPAGPVGLVIGALGPRMLRLAGSVADGVCLNLMPADAVPRQLAEIRAGAAEAGRSLDDFTVMARMHTVVSDDIGAARDVVRTAFGPYFAQPVYNRFLSWCGYGDEAAAIAASFASGDRAGVSAALHDGLIDAISLVGPPGRIRERLAPFDAAGIDVAAISLAMSDRVAVGKALAALAPA